MRRSPLPVLLVWLVPLLGFLSGCLTADVRLEADGSGILDVKFDPVLPTDAARERALFQAPGVTVETVEVGEGRPGLTGATTPAWVHVRAAFTDVTALDDAGRLRRFTIALADAGEGTKRLSVSITPQTHGKGFTHKDPVTIRVQLPGDVVESSATVEGRTVTWSFPASEFVGSSPLTMQTTYRVPDTGGDAAGKAAEGSPAAPAAAPSKTPPAQAPPAQAPSGVEPSAAPPSS